MAAIYFLYYTVLILLWLFGIVVTFVLGALFGYTVLQPVSDLARRQEKTFRFYTADFFSLTLVLILPATFVSVIMRNRGISGETLISGEPLYLIGFIAFAATVLAWTRGALKLSSIDVSSSSKRFVFLGFMVPLAFLGAGLAVPLLVFGVVEMIRSTLPKFLIIVEVCGLIAVPILAIAGNRVSRWVVRKDAA